MLFILTIYPMIGDETTTLNGEQLMMIPMTIGEAPFFSAYMYTNYMYMPEL